MAMARTVFSRQLLRHFQHKGTAMVLTGQRIQNGRQFAFEVHVHDSAEDLGNFGRLRFSWSWFVSVI